VGGFFLLVASEQGIMQNAMRIPGTEDASPMHLHYPEIIVRLTEGREIEGMSRSAVSHSVPIRRPSLGTEGLVKVIASRDGWDPRGSHHRIRSHGSHFDCGFDDEAG
jgi:hypothetical protein